MGGNQSSPEKKRLSIIQTFVKDQQKGLIHLIQTQQDYKKRMSKRERHEDLLILRQRYADTLRTEKDDCNQRTEDLLPQIWNSYDTDGSGDISVGELEVLLTDYLAALEETLPEFLQTAADMLWNTAVIDVKNQRRRSVEAKQTDSCLANFGSSRYSERMKFLFENSLKELIETQLEQVSKAKHGIPGLAAAFLDDLDDDFNNRVEEQSFYDGWHRVLNDQSLSLVQAFANVIPELEHLPPELTHDILS